MYMQTTTMRYPRLSTAGRTASNKTISKYYEYLDVQQYNPNSNATATTTLLDTESDMFIQQ